MWFDKKTAFWIGLAIATILSCIFWGIAFSYSEGGPFYRVTLTVILPIACYLIFPLILQSFSHPNSH
jgi:hypothetical protein